jgi:hypothetical protein
MSPKKILLDPEYRVCTDMFLARSQPSASPEEWIETDSSLSPLPHLTAPIAKQLFSLPEIFYLVVNDFSIDNFFSIGNDSAE